MPRNGSGTYTLPSGNPVVSGTIILADWANDTMPDLGDAITNSLSRTGQGGMLVPLKFVDGDALTPAMTFTSEPSMGMYRAAVSVIGFSIGGFEQFRVKATGNLQVVGAAPLNAADLTRKDYVDAAVAGGISGKVNRSGDTMTGQLKGITPVDSSDLTRKDYVDAEDAKAVKLTGAQNIDGPKTFTQNPFSIGAQNTGNSALTRYDYVTNNFVRLTTNQSVAGVKTFTSAPRSSAAPSEVSDLTRKDYVDGLDGQNVKLSGSQTIAGSKTFSSNVACTVGAPTQTNHLTRKDYVDGLDGANVKLTGDQSVAGLKTFTSNPRSSAGQSAAANALTRRDWVEAAILAIPSGVELPVGTLQFGYNPNGLQVGTWTQLPEGTFIMATVGGASPSGGSNNAVNISHSHTASQVAHSHAATQAAHNHSASQGTHGHGLLASKENGNWGGRIAYTSSTQNYQTNAVQAASAGAITIGSTTPAITVPNATPSITVNSAGVSGTGLNRPLFKGVEVWQRTA